MAFWNSSKSASMPAGGVSHDRSPDPIGNLDPKLVGQLAKSFAHMNLPKGSSPKEIGKDASPLEQQKDALFAIREHLVKQARDLAATRGTPPTLEDYRLMCKGFEETPEGTRMVAEGKWNQKVAADLSGQNLSGFFLSDPKLASAECKKNQDFYNQDCDNAIEFYANTNLCGANLKNCYVDPATSFNDQIAKAENLEGLTFNGMKDGETFVFSGRYKNINLTNFNGGTIEFASGSVEEINISGKCARIHMGEHSVVRDINVSDEFRILALDMQRDSVLSGDLKQATLSMTCHFEPGATFHNVHVSGNVDGLDLRGLNLNNFAINNTPITSPEQLRQLGAECDATTKISASDGFVAECKKREQIAAGTYVEENVRTASAPPQAPAQAPPTADIDPRLAAMLAAVAPIASTVKVEGTAPEGEPKQTLAINSMKKQVDPSQVASPGDRFMERNQGQENRQA